MAILQVQRSDTAVPSSADSVTERTNIRIMYNTDILYRLAFTNDLNGADNASCRHKQCEENWLICDTLLRKGKERKGKGKERTVSPSMSRLPLIRLLSYAHRSAGRVIHGLLRFARLLLHFTCFLGQPVISCAGDRDSPSACWVLSPVRAPPMFLT